MYQILEAAVAVNLGLLGLREYLDLDGILQRAFLQLKLQLRLKKHQELIQRVPGAATAHVAAMPVAIVPLLHVKIRQSVTSVRTLVKHVTAPATVPAAEASKHQSHHRPIGLWLGCLLRRLRPPHRRRNESVIDERRIPRFHKLCKRGLCLFDGSWP